MTPSQARIDAALRLAEAVDEYGKELRMFGPINVVEPTNYTRLAAALSAYRATLPELRSRAEVDAEIAHEVRYYSAMEPPGIGPEPSALIEKLNRLVVEPTAPEEPACSVCDGKGYTDDCNCEYVHSCNVCPAGARWSKGIPMRNANATGTNADPTPDPCGCDQSNDLSRKLQEIQTEVDLWMRGHKGGTSAMSAIGLILKGE